jgi:hypothetical protein
VPEKAPQTCEKHPVIMKTEPSMSARGKLKPGDFRNLELARKLIRDLQHNQLDKRRIDYWIGNTTTGEGPHRGRGNFKNQIIFLKNK